MTTHGRVSKEWLALREPADAAARARELVEHLVRESPRWVIHDLGCGTGSMGRWLAPQLPGPQHWVLHDRDEDLLRRAAASVPGAEGRPGDLARLTADDLAGASLVTASALLDLLTLAEVRRLAEAVAAVACPALLTLTVTGRVELEPADPLDAEVAAAFDAHQRRESGGRRLLGPDAATATREAFAARGAGVAVRASPWRLGPHDAELLRAWLPGWVGAAREQQPDVAPGTYLAGRLAAAGEGRLRVTVHHEDLFVRWD